MSDVKHHESMRHCKAPEDDTAAFGALMSVFLMCAIAYGVCDHIWPQDHALHAHFNSGECSQYYRDRACVIGITRRMSTQVDRWLGDPWVRLNLAHIEDCFKDSP